MINEDRTIREHNVLTGKAHQSRLCVVCKQPITDEKAVSLDMGGGLELLVHKTCRSALEEEVRPETIRMPVGNSKPTAGIQIKAKPHATPKRQSFLIPEPKSGLMQSKTRLQGEKGHSATTSTPTPTPAALGLPDTLALTEDQLFALLTPEQVITCIKAGFIREVRD